MNNKLKCKICHSHLVLTEDRLYCSNCGVEYNFNDIKELYEEQIIKEISSLDYQNYLINPENFNVVKGMPDGGNISYNRFNYNGNYIVDLVMINEITHSLVNSNLSESELENSISRFTIYSKKLILNTPQEYQEIVVKQVVNSFNEMFNFLSNKSSSSILFDDEKTWDVNFLYNQEMRRTIFFMYLIDSTGNKLLQDYMYVTYSMQENIINIMNNFSDILKTKFLKLPDSKEELIYILKFITFILNSLDNFYSVIMYQNLIVNRKIYYFNDNYVVNFLNHLDSLEKYYNKIFEKIDSISGDHVIYGFYISSILQNLRYLVEGEEDDEM